MDSTPRRKVISKEQWDPLKPVVERLYVEEGRTLRQVAAYLKEHHDLNPTKRQLLRRISDWGIEKNVKQQERRAILRALESHGNVGDIDIGTLGSRKFSKAKIERWRKAEGVVGTQLHGESSNISDNYRSFSEWIVLTQDQGNFNSSRHTQGDDPGHCSPESLPRNEAVHESSFYGIALPRLEVDKEQILDPWTTVDVIGSPRLTGFIGCMMLELGDELKALDLSEPDEEEIGEDHVLDLPTSSSQPTYLAALIETAPRNRGSQLLSPFDELYPFPQQRQYSGALPVPKTNHLLHHYSLKMKEVECKSKIKNTSLLDPAEMTDLVENMRSIAQRHYELDHYHVAESWWRRVVDYSRKIPGYQPVRVLEACLWVIDNFRLRGKPTESRNLHQGVHRKMVSLFLPDHDLVVFSKRILCSILSDLGEHQAQETLQREIVQICLSKYGAKNQALVCILGFLGMTLFSNGKVSEAEVILCLHVQLDLEISDYAEKCQADRENALSAMCTLAELLNGQERYGESSKILDFAEYHFKDLLKLGSFYGNKFCRRKAEALYAKGDLLGCEELLRTILQHTSSSVGWDSVNSMEKLSELLEGTNRATDALIWRERVFLMEIQLCGIEHRWSREGCEVLGFCYAKLGRYDEAVRHFHQTIEKLSLDPGAELESRSEYTEAIHGWIWKVEEMKRDAENVGESSNLEDTQLCQAIN